MLFSFMSTMKDEVIARKESDVVVKKSARDLRTFISCCDKEITSSVESAVEGTAVCNCIAVVTVAIQLEFKS